MRRLIIDKTQARARLIMEERKLAVTLSIPLSTTDCCCGEVIPCDGTIVPCSPYCSEEYPPITYGWPTEEDVVAYVETLAGPPEPCDGGGPCGGCYNTTCDSTRDPSTMWGYYTCDEE